MIWSAFVIANIIAFIWYFFTVVAGVRAADGKVGPLTKWGDFFDSVFGLNACKKVPAHNQNPPYKEPVILCPDLPVPYPHAGQTNFNIAVSPEENQTQTGTAVRDVGGVTSLAVKGALVSAFDYIVQQFTGGSDASKLGNFGDYNKEIFKGGLSPYCNTSQSTSKGEIGYYYYMDQNNKEVPVIPPATANNPLPNPPLLQPEYIHGLQFTPSPYGEDPANHGYPTGWKAYLGTQLQNAMGYSTAFNGFGNGLTRTSTKPYASNQLIYFPLPQNGGQISWSNEFGFKDAKNNEWLVNSMLLKPNKLKWKAFNKKGTEAEQAAGLLH